MEAVGGLEDGRHEAGRGQIRRGFPSSWGLLPGLLAVYREWPVWNSVPVPTLASLEDEELASVLWNLLNLFCFQSLESHLSAKGQKH